MLDTTNTVGITGIHVLHFHLCRGHSHGCCCGSVCHCGPGLQRSCNTGWPSTCNKFHPMPTSAMTAYATCNTGKHCRTHTQTHTHNHTITHTHTRTHKYTGKRCHSPTVNTCSPVDFQGREAGRHTSSSFEAAALAQLPARGGDGSLACSIDRPQQSRGREHVAREHEGSKLSAYIQRWRRLR